MSRSGPMTCPVDGATLVMSERQSIEIDYCPTCRGVWLDRGELDKIIERATAENAAAAPAAAAPPPPPNYVPPPQPHYAPPPPQQHYGDPYRGHHGHSHGYPHKRRKSFLEELFD